MSSIAINPSPSSSPGFQQPNRAVLVGRYLRRNKGLALGLAILLFLILFSGIGMIWLSTSTNAAGKPLIKVLPYPLAVKNNRPPDFACVFAGKQLGKDCFPLGTDKYGRDLLAAMILGIAQTGLIGLAAGILGVVIGTVLGFVAAFFGGPIDSVIKSISEVLLPIPPYLIQVIIVASIDKKSITIWTMALIVVMLAWMGPTRVIRAQVLSMKERMFVNVSKLSGMNNLEIIFKELLPNLLPFLLAQMVGQVTGAIFASFGLSVIGLGPLNEPLIGNTIYFAQQQSAFLIGWWWWPLWPILACVLIFGSLTLISIGLDEVANPRVRRSE